MNRNTLISVNIKLIIIISVNISLIINHVFFFFL